METKNLRSFVIAGSIAFCAVIALAFAMGQTGTSPKARAADPLPDTIAAADIGDGGLDVETVRLLAEDEGFRAWTAKDLAGNVCVIPEAAQTGMNGSFCVAEATFGERGLSGSILSEPSYDPNTTPYLQVYLLPDGADSEAAAKLIPDARAFGQLLVRFFTGSPDESHMVDVPGLSGQLQVFGSVA